MSDLSNTYEKASKKQKKGGWGSLRRSPPGEGTPSNTPSDAKKGRAKREYPTPGFVLTRITGPTGRSSYEIRKKGAGVGVQPSPLRQRPTGCASASL